MRGWYNIHDHEQSRIGFVPFIDSTKQVPRSVTIKPKISLKQHLQEQEADSSNLILGINEKLFWYTLGAVLGIPLVLVIFLALLNDKYSLSRRVELVQRPDDSLVLVILV
jgi:hypothetical protein